MLNFCRLHRSFPYVLAVVLMAVSTSGYAQSLKEKTRAYSQMIGEKHELLGTAILIQRKMIDAIALDMNVVNNEGFIEDEETMARFLEKIGLVEDLESMTLPGDDSELRDLHALFIKTVAYLRACTEFFEAAAFEGGLATGAESAWFYAMENFMAFTEKLNELLGEAPLGVGGSGEDTPTKEPAPGGHLIKPGAITLPTGEN